MLRLKAIVTVTLALLLIGGVGTIAINEANDRLSGETTNHGTTTIEVGNSTIETINEKDVEFKITNIDGDEVDYDIIYAPEDQVILEVTDCPENNKVTRYITHYDINREIEIIPETVTTDSVDLTISSTEIPFDNKASLIDIYSIFPLMIVIGFLVPIMVLVKKVAL